MANESLRNVIAQIAATQPVSSPSIGQAAIDATNILKQQEMARQLSPEQLLLRRTKEAMQTALSTGNKDLAKQMYEKYQLPGETPDFDFLEPAPGKEPESAVAFGGRVYKGGQALMSQFAGFMDQIDTPEEAQQADQWFVQQGGSITSDPHYKEAGMPSIDTSVIETNGRKVLINKKTGQVIKDLGKATPKGPMVSVSTGDVTSDIYAKEEAKELAKANVKWDSEISKRFSEYKSKDLQIKGMEELLADPDFKTGKIAALAQPLHELFGTKQGTSTQLMDAFGNVLLQEAKEAVKGGQISDRDVEIMMKAIPHVGKTRAANLKILDMYRKLDQRMKAARKKYNSLKKAGISIKDRRLLMEQWLTEQGSLFGEEDTEEQATEGQATGRKIVRTGTSNGRKVVQYDDGSVEYAE